MWLGKKRYVDKKYSRAFNKTWVFNTFRRKDPFMSADMRLYFSLSERPIGLHSEGQGLPSQAKWHEQFSTLEVTEVEGRWDILISVL